MSVISNPTLHGVLTGNVASDKPATTLQPVARLQPAQSPGKKTSAEKNLSDAMLRARLVNMKPSETLTTLRALGLRTRIGDQEIPEEACYLGEGDRDAREILMTLRRQVMDFCSDHNFDHIARRKIRYFYQVQMVPRILREMMSATMGLTYISNDERGTFPRGVRFWSLRDLRFVTLNFRLDRPVSGKNVRPDARMDHVDVRIHTADIDRARGIIQIGGTSQREDGTLSRCLLSRLLSYSPGGIPLSIPGNKLSVIDNALAIHEEMELAAVSDVVAKQSQPQLPRPYLVFGQDQLPSIEYSAGLQSMALDDLRHWLHLGCPTNTQRFSWAKDLGGEFICYDPDNICDWGFIYSVLGEKRVDTLLDAVWHDNLASYGNDLAVPASFFDNNSGQRPFDSCKEVVVEIGELLGRKILLPDGREVTDSRSAGIQVIDLPVPEKPLIGEFGDYWEYDFSSTEVGLESDFQ